MANEVDPTQNDGAATDLEEESLAEPGTEEAAVARRLWQTWPYLAVAGGIGALEWARSRFQDSHMFAPTRFPLAGSVWQPGERGLVCEDVHFLSEDGTELHGWWLEEPSADLTVVYCHGNAGSLADQIDILARLRKLRVNVFAFDYRGYGKSAGTPSEKGLFADVRAACDYVAEHYGVAYDRMMLFGHSLGGAVAIDGACHRPVAGLIVQSSFTQSRDMARHFYPDLPVHLLTRNYFRSIEKVPSLAMPKLFIHGQSDTKIPYQLGRALYEAASEPKDWFDVSRAGHSDVHLLGSLRYYRRLTHFRRLCLRRP